MVRSRSSLWGKLQEAYRTTPVATSHISCIPPIPPLLTTTACELIDIWSAHYFDGRLSVIPSIRGIPVKLLPTFRMLNIIIRKHPRCDLRGLARRILRKAKEPRSPLKPFFYKPTVYTPLEFSPEYRLILAKRLLIKMRDIAGHAADHWRLGNW